MKLTLALVLGLVAFAAADHHHVKKWMHIKIMEDCFGPNVINFFKAKCYEAYSNCTGTLVPQLFLPQFSEKIREIKSDPFGAYLASLPKEDAASEEDPMAIMDTMFVASGSFGSLPTETSRNAKQIGDADKFKERVKESYEERKAKMEKKVCMLKYRELVYDDLDLNIDKFVEEVQHIDTSDWLKNKLVNSMWKCYSFVHSLPDELLDEDLSFAKMARIKHFFRCVEDRKLDICMNHDMLLKLEANFGDVKTISKQTGMSENELEKFAEMMFLHSVGHH